MLAFNGYIPLRRGLLEHLREGRISLREYEVFTILLLWADARTGIATTNGSGLVFLSGNQLNLDYTQKCLASLEKKGYIKRPFYVQGQRGDQKIFIDKYVCTTGLLRLKQLTFANTTDWENPVYENVTEDAGESAGVKAGVNTSVNAASNKKKKHENKNSSEWIDEEMESGAAAVSDQSFNQTAKTSPVPESSSSVVSSAEPGPGTGFVSPVEPGTVPTERSTPSPSSPAAENPPARRLAEKFFHLLDQPREHQNAAPLWEHKFSLLLLEYKGNEEELSDLLTFALEENDYSVEYLNKANDPMGSLMKNIESLTKQWRARRKADAAAGKAAQKRAAGRTDAVDNRPEYRKDKTKFL